MLALRRISRCRPGGGRTPRAGPGRSARGASARLADQPGFTLIETLVVIGVLGVAFTAGFMFYAGTVNRTQDTEARKNALAGQRVAIERIARDVREAAMVTAPAVGEGGDLLGLSGPSGAVSYDCETTPGTCLRVDGGSTELLIEGLDPDSTAVFTTEAPNHVRARLQLLPDGRDAAIALEREVTLRNDGGSP